MHPNKPPNKYVCCFCVGHRASTFCLTRPVGKPGSMCVDYPKVDLQGVRIQGNLWVQVILIGVLFGCFGRKIDGPGLIIYQGHLFAPKGHLWSSLAAQPETRRKVSQDYTGNLWVQIFFGPNLRPGAKSHILASVLWAQRGSGAKSHKIGQVIRKGDRIRKVNGKSGRADAARRLAKTSALIREGPGEPA